ncbi:MAG: hypothetical protein ACRCXC_01980 [Legionella sp.]
MKYHRELKENDYLAANVRNSIYRSPTKDYTFQHDIIEHTGLGNCQELADYLIVEIGRAIHEVDAKAELRVVESQSKDHVYLEILIQFQNERERSRWEVDAWDPRILDISLRPDGSIKNSEQLDYGYRVIERAKLNTEDMDAQKKLENKHLQFLSAIRKPVAGPPSAPGTPKREALDKHKLLYSDHSLKEAYAAKKLDPEGNLHYLQRVSFWQQAQPDDSEETFERPTKKAKII